MKLYVISLTIKQLEVVFQLQFELYTVSLTINNLEVILQPKLHKLRQLPSPEKQPLWDTILGPGVVLPSFLHTLPPW